MCIQYAFAACRRMNHVSLDANICAELSAETVAAEKQ
jgi:hypothetical protein